MDAGRLVQERGNSTATQEQGTTHGNADSLVSRTSIKSFFKHKAHAFIENKTNEDILERKDDQRGASSATQEQSTTQINQDSPVSNTSIKSFFKSKAQTFIDNETTYAILDDKPKVD